MQDAIQNLKDRLLQNLYILQKCYQKEWILDAINPWGFGNRMRDYLLEGHRRIKFDYPDHDGVIELKGRLSYE